MRSHWLVKSLALGAILALAALGLMFGGAVHRCHVMSSALADMEGCAGDKNEAACMADAHARLMLAKGGK